MVGSTINLISETHHLCERRKHAFMVLLEYTIISQELGLRLSTSFFCLAFLNYPISLNGFFLIGYFVILEFWEGICDNSQLKKKALNFFKFRCFYLFIYF